MNMHELQRQIPSRNASNVMNAAKYVQQLPAARWVPVASCQLPLLVPGAIKHRQRCTGAAAVTVTGATPTAYVSYKMRFRVLY